MPCPLFVAGRDCRCTAVATHVVPTLHEREQFCSVDRRDRCPTHRAYRAAGAPLSEEAYWAIWIPRTATPAIAAVNALHEVEAAV